MSKLVDDAVCDYFSALLNETAIIDEPVKESCHVHDGYTSAEVSLQRQQSNTAGQTSKPFATAEGMNHQALAQLLAPVSVLQLEPKFEGESQVSDQNAIVNSIVDTSQQALLSAVTVENKSGALIQNTALPEHTALNSIAENSHLKITNVAAQSKVTPLSVTKDLIEQLDDEFQVLFFKVAGLTLAVPLVSLGGIVNLERINHLMGRPNWYLGVQQHRGSQLNVVDTCAWVMPEKYDQTLAKNVTYKYIVVLQDSSWGLTCESLVNTVKIHKSKVNWRNSAGKRPWLAGVVKEQMCGILNVDALIAMLDSGLDSQG